MEKYQMFLMGIFMTIMGVGLGLCVYYADLPLWVLLVTIGALPLLATFASAFLSAQVKKIVEEFKYVKTLKKRDRRREEDETLLKHKFRDITSYSIRNLYVKGEQLELEENSLVEDVERRLEYCKKQAREIQLDIELLEGLLSTKGREACEHEKD